MNGFERSAGWESSDANRQFIVPAVTTDGESSRREVDPVRRCASAASNPTAAAEVTVVPPDTVAAALINLERGHRAVEFPDHNSGTEQAGARVGVPRTGPVSCCQCPALLEISYLGYGDMVRRVEAAGWHYRPARHDRDRAWCPQCQNDAGSAAP